MKVLKSSEEGVTSIDLDYKSDSFVNFEFGIVRLKTFLVTRRT